MLKNSNPLLHIIVSFVFALTFYQEAKAQWVEMNNGLYGGNITSIAVTASGNNIFAGTPGGVFMSTNNGSSWTKTGLTSINVQSLASSGNNIFAGTKNNGIFLSTNNGSSWAPVNTGLTNTNVVSLAISGSNIFAGTGGGVFLSTNDGSGWAAVNTGIGIIASLAISGNNIFAGTYGGGVFLSTNNGSSWAAVNTGLTSTNVVSLAISGNNIFAGTYGGGIFLSTNNGSSWTAVNTGLTNPYIYSLAISGSNIFAGTSGGVFLSINNGSGWAEVNTGLTYPYIHSLAISGNNIFAGTRSDGVYSRLLSDFPPTISSFEPTSALVGSTVTIAGSHFSTTSANYTVMFNGVTAPIVLGNETSLTVAVPTGATTGKISVTSVTTSGTFTVQSPSEFLVLPLAISPLSQFQGLGGPGTLITIMGTGFSSVKANNIVAFNGTAARVDNSTPISISTTVPANCTTGKITVTVVGVTATSSTDFIVTKLGIIQTIYPEYFTIGDNGATVSLMVNDINELQSIKIKRRGITEDDSKLKVDPLTFTTTGNTINLSLPASYFSDPLGLYAWFTLTEKLGTEIQSAPGYIYLKYPTTSSEQVIPDLKSGRSVAAYQLISVPLVLAKPSIKDALANLGAVDDRKWRLFSFANEALTENPLTIELGKGYWFIMRDQNEINPGEGHTVKVTPEAPHKISLTTDWNLIGNPYNFSISWEDVMAHNNLPPEKLKIVQYLNGKIDDAEQTIKRYRGAFVNSDVERDIEIPVINRSPSGGRKAVRKPSPINEKDWQVSLTFEEGEFSNGLLGFGMNTKAIEGKDLWDGTNMPMLEGLSSFDINFREVQGKTLVKDIVPPTENYSWQATISSDNGGIIRWENFYFGDNDKQLVIEMSDRVELIDMRSSTQAIIPKGNHVIKFHYGARDYVDGQVLENSTRIGHIYPNPLRKNAGQLFISISLPEGENEVGLSLKSIYGSGALLSYKGVYTGGRQSIDWANDFSQLPSGLYLLRVEIKEGSRKGFHGYRKILVE